MGKEPVPSQVSELVAPAGAAVVVAVAPVLSVQVRPQMRLVLVELTGHDLL